MFCCPNNCLNQNLIKKYNEVQFTQNNIPNPSLSNTLQNENIIINDEYTDIPNEDNDSIHFFTNVKEENKTLKFLSTTNKYFHSNSVTSNFDLSASFQAINFVALIENHKQHNKKHPFSNVFTKEKTISTVDLEIKTMY